MRTTCMITAVLLSAVLAAPLGAQGVKFFEGSWEEAFAAAKEQNKYLYVDCYTEWCGPCKYMDQETFTDPDVAALIDSHYIALKRDMEKGEGLRVAVKYRISGYPTGLVFNSDGELVQRIGGGLPPDAFLEYFRANLNEESHIRFAGISRPLDLDFPDFLAKRYGPEWKTVREEARKYLEEHDDWFDEVTWTVLHFFGRDEQHEKFVVDNREKLSELYGKDEIDDMRRSFIERRISGAIKNNDEDAFAAELLSLTETFPWMVGRIEKPYWNRFWEGTGNWHQLMRATQEEMETDSLFSSYSMNSVAWTFYQKCDDPECLDWACSEMKKVIEKEPLYAFVDTYAALLYKTGRNEEAETWALKAIEIGKDADEDVSETEGLLAKIRGEAAAENEE